MPPSVVAELARGASFFTHADDSFVGSVGAAGQIAWDREETPAQGWARIIDELLRFLRLEDDWDGAGTPAPSQDLVHGAIKLAQRLQNADRDPADRVVVGVNGTVYFEWYCPSGYLEIEVLSPVDAELRRIGDGASQADIIAMSLS